MNNPVNDEKSQFPVFRSGSWYDIAWYSRLSDRYGHYPDREFNYLGFRVVRNKQ